MRKTKLTAIILIVVSMLCSMVPAWARAIDSIDVINFSFEVTLTSSDDYSPVMYGANYGASGDFGLGQLAAKLFGRQKIDGAWQGFTTLNFDNIAEGSGAAAYLMEYEEEQTRDISDVEDIASVAYAIDAADGVAIDNLYLALATRGTDGIEFAGIPATSADETIGVALSEMTKAENFLFSTGTGTQIDLTRFCGLGLVRMNVSADETAPASSGRIFMKKLAIVNLGAIDDLACEANKDEATISFTAPTVEGLTYEINISGNDGSERTVTLTSEDFILDGEKFIWKDTEVEGEIIYTYKVTLIDTAYGLSSVSNTASVRIPENIGGEEIPATGEDSVVIEFPVRNYSWTSASEWLDNVNGAPKTSQVFDSHAIKADMASQSILKFNLNVNNIFKTEEEAAEYSGHAFDYYVVGYLAGNLSGGPSKTNKECTNIAAVAETGSAMYRMYIDPELDLTNSYFAIGQRWFGGNKDRLNYVGVPMNDYVKEEDKGKIITVSIPLTDFKLSTPGAINRIWSYSWDSKADQEAAEVDLQYFNFIGVLRDCSIAQPANETGNVYISDMRICNVKAVENLEIRDITPTKVILGWDHTPTKVSKYNIYREENGSKVYVGSTTLNRFADVNDGNGFEVWETYKYYVEAVDEMGVTSAMREISARVEPIAKPGAFKAVNYYSETDHLAIDISWQPVSYGDIDKYVLYRNGQKYQEFEADETSFRDEDITFGVDYTYYMISVDVVGDTSINTEEITVTAACIPPVNNLAYSVSDNDVTISWDENELAEEYIVTVNGQAFVTADTSYQMNDVPYYTEIDVAVSAVNAAGAKSLESRLRKFAVIRDEEVAEVVFDDAIKSGFKVTTTGNADVKTDGETVVVGDASLCFDFTGRALEDQLAGLSHSAWKLKEQRDNNSKLTFWMYADDELELDKLSIGLQGTTTLVWDANFPIRALLPMSDYLTARNKWVYVEIPLQSFADEGKAEYQGQEYVKTLKYDEIKALVFQYNNSRSLNGAKFYIDDIRIVKGEAWSVSGLTDDNGTAITTEISANAKSILIASTAAVDPSTLSSETVWLEDAAGNAVNTFAAVENGVITLKLLEALAPSTEYTLNIKGVKSAGGVACDITKTFTSNADAVSGDYAQITAITPVITESKSGSTVTVKLAMPQAPVYNVGAYNITLAYNQNMLAPNGAAAVTLHALKDAAVTTADGVVTISGTANDQILSGELAEVKFSVKTGGTTQVTAGGTMNVVNAKSSDSAEVAVNASISMTVATTGAVGGGGGGGGGGGTAGRENSTIKGDTEVELSDTDSPKGDGSETPSSVTFTDINSVPWAAEAIKALIEEGIISGYPDNTVKPEKTITREEFASLLIRTFGFKTEVTESPFADVQNDAWYATAIITAKDKDIVSGIDAQNFGVGSTITREDMCAMIYRAMQASRMSPGEVYDEYRFADEADISSYAKDAINVLYKAGIISGVSDTEFAPKTEVNRAMAARVLYGVMGMM